MYTKAFVFTHIYQKSICLSIHITCVFYMCKIFNTTNRFSAEQSIKKAPIFEFIFTQCLLNYTMLERYLGQPVNPQGHQTSQWFWLAAQENIEIQTIHTYIYINTYKLHWNMFISTLKHLYFHTQIQKSCVHTNYLQLNSSTCVQI